MLNSHDSQLFGAPMRVHEYTPPLANQSPPLPREYSLLQTHSPGQDENSIGVKIEYVNHNMSSSPETYNNMSPKYEQNILHGVKQEYDGRVKDGVKNDVGNNNQNYVALPPFLNWLDFWKEVDFWIIKKLRRQQKSVGFYKWVREIVVACALTVRHMAAKVLKHLSNAKGFEITSK